MLLLLLLFWTVMLLPEPRFALERALGLEVAEVGRPPCFAGRDTP